MLSILTPVEQEELKGAVIGAFIRARKPENMFSQLAG